MGERARRSRDGSSRYSIDTLFPGLSNNSTFSQCSRTSSPVVGLDPGFCGLSSHSIPLHGQSVGIKRYKTTYSSEADKEIVIDICDPDVEIVEPKDNSGQLKEEDEEGEFGMNSSSDGSKVFRDSGETKVNIGGRSIGRRACSKSIWSTTAMEGRGVGVTKRKSLSPLKPATQPKQMYPAIGLTKLSRKGMFEVFQPWVLQTYGDSAKTKTITKKKYNRIVKTLRGEEINNAENSKFRFWVKAKGFHIGPPPGLHEERGTALLNPIPNEPDLFVPTTVKDGSDSDKPIFKRVAVVEYFFDIIYTVHVETEAKNGKHAGQKRTYRAITEKYAFLPREAVTKFLLQCTECQKRGSPGVETTSSGSGTSSKMFVAERSPSPLAEEKGRLPEASLHFEKCSSASTADINFGLPFTTTYLQRQQEEKQMRERDGYEEDEDDDEISIGDLDNRMVKMSHATGRKKLTPSKVKVKVRAPIREPNITDSISCEDDHEMKDLTVKRKSTSGSSRSKNGEGKEMKQEVSGVSGSAVDWLGYQPLGLKKETQTTNNNIYSNGKHEFREQSSPLSLNDRLVVNHEPVHDETSSNGNKDDEDDDDDESDDRIDTQQHDPERLKAFNMFVRLFVDENLDRMVPISKQPKEKIQAIIDSCTRQFPEFAERARKRIRTYLKSCRRNKRSRDGGWESSRPTPAHLTSVQAEQILALACDNESQNAKRMRMGLEPISQPLPMPLSENRNSKENGHTSGSSGESTTLEKPSKVSSSNSHVVSSNIAATIAAVAANTTNSNSLSPSSLTPSSITANVSTDQNINLSLNGATNVGDSILNQLPSSGLATKSLERSPLVDYSRALNGNGASSMSMYRPNFSQTFQRPSPFPSLFPAVTTSAVVGALGNPTFPHNVSPLPVANGDAGPTDLSMKSKQSLTQKLNATELATVRQLITGYRESAAFLLRSADELEQLLIQQQ